jgi:hypothetical protein
MQSTAQEANRRRAALAMLGVVLLASACSDDQARRDADKLPASAIFRPLTSDPSTAAGVIAPGVEWQRAPFAFVQTTLSPATLFHSELRHLSFFTGLADHGLGAPTFAAYGADGGPRIATNNATLDTRAMNECWVLVWFAGAKGWTNWDSPWAVFLQRRPSAMRLDANGLHMDFPGPAGDAVLMPLYGDYKPPQQGRELPAAHNAPAKPIKTWEWPKFLPRDLLMRVRYWAGVSREFPLNCEDSFNVDEARDAATIRQRIHWHSIADDWRTKHLKLAPVSPLLALPAQNENNPVRFSKPPVDLNFVTADGSYFGVESVDSFDVTVGALQLTNQFRTTNTHPVIAVALTRLRDMARQKPHRSTPDPSDSAAFCAAISGDQWDLILPHKSEGSAPNWPAPTWKSWQTPSGAPWNFGHVRPGPKVPLGEVRVLPLNRNSHAVIYSPPQAAQ